MMMTTQAPSWNLVAAKMKATTAVSTAPKPLRSIFDRQRGSWVRTDPRSLRSSPGARRPDFHQRLAMPPWDRAKDRKTPIA